MARMANIAIVHQLLQEWMEEERCRMEQDRGQRRAYRARMEMLAAYSFEVSF